MRCEFAVLAIAVREEEEIVGDGAGSYDVLSGDEWVLVDVASEVTSSLDVDGFGGERTSTTGCGVAEEVGEGFNAKG